MFIKFVVTNTLTLKTPGPDGLTAEFSKHLRKKEY